jgi:hypothetical protein
MKVKITKCENKLKWYHNEIGFIYQVRQSFQYYEKYIIVNSTVRQGDFIDKSDCEILSE